MTFKAYRLYIFEPLKARLKGPVMATEQGTVKWFQNSKGFGFISRKGKPDVFVHFSNIEGDGYRTLNENEPVEFEVQDSPKGPQAVNVRKL